MTLMDMVTITVGNTHFCGLVKFYTVVSNGNKLREKEVDFFGRNIESVRRAKEKNCCTIVFCKRQKKDEKFR